MIDLLDQLLTKSRYGRPFRGMRGTRQSLNRTARAFISWGRGRISLEECRRRVTANYRKTGCYMGPAGWMDGVER